MPASSLSLFLTPRKTARHAKPSKAAPVLMAGGMTAAFAAVDVGVLAGAASAGGSVAQFERLAQCESGGNWSINTGNGYYGGIQFNLATWRSLGFSGYPHEASKATQIAAGQKLQGQRGWSPWPACSRKLGLTGDGGYSGSGDAAPEPAAAPRSATPERRTTAERASRTRSSTATRAAREAVAKNKAARLATLRALRVTTAPSFDGHVLSTADAGTYRIAVKHWQRRMAARGWRVTVDGHFGPQSAAVARRFAADKQVVAVAGTVNKGVWDAAWTTPVKF